MSSNWIFNIRKHSGDPIAFRFKALAEQFAAFDSANAQPETQDILNKMRTDSSLLQYCEIIMNRRIGADWAFYPIFEPDNQYVRLWFTFEHFGSLVFDSSGFKHQGYIAGFDQPIAMPGLDQGVGGSIAMLLNGTDQRIEVFDQPDLQMIGQVVGFSVATLVAPTTFEPTAGNSPRHIAAKVDDPNNAWFLFFDTAEPRSGGFTDQFNPNFFYSIPISTGYYRIFFWIIVGGIDYSVMSVDGVAKAGNWYWVAVTFDATTNTPTIYLNGRPVATITTTTMAAAESTLTLDHAPTSLYVGAGVGDGFLQGAMGDFRYYREKVLSAGEVANLNLNMISIAPLPFGRVPIASLCFAAGPAAIVYFYSISLQASLAQYILASFTILGVGQTAGSEGTYSAWFKLQTPGAVSMGIMGRASGGSMQPYVTTAGVLNCDFNFNTHAIDAATTGVNVMDNKWHHVVVSNSNVATTGGYSQVYLDGIQYVSDFNNDYLSGTGSLRIGSTYGTQYFNGQLSDVKIYNVQLTPSEVSALFAGYDVQRGLVGNFRMTEGSGTTTTDSKNGNVATLVNGATWSVDSVDRAV